MANSVATQSENFDLARHALSQAKSVLNDAIGAVRDKVYVSGQADEALLQNAQQDCYDLAMLSADVWSAQCLVDFAETQSQSSLVCQLTWKFVAEKVRGVMAAQFAGASTLEKSSEAVEPLGAHPALQQFLDEHGARDSYADLGRLLSEAEINELPSGLTEEKALIADTFKRFADEVVAPLAGVIHREDRDIPDEIIQSAARMGCFGTCIPERFGGLQPDEKPDSLGMIVVTEELSRGSLGAAGSLITRPEIAARALLAGGTESQKSGWLPQLAAGEKLCAISITEPNTGSDVAAVSLRATPTEGGWLLNGAKTWCTFAGKSEVLVVLGRTNPDASSGYRGLSLFLVEKPAYSGHEFTFSPSGGGSLSGKAISTLGYRGMHSYDL
ncbi:MAG: acyl-CoA dehydrogenase family protein, partial [Pseudomonadota bacterium]|nr:acyl-CoA dehydrogenase family protein [Pseudomonadota bacterium]